jgi:hypothetical protein
MTESNNVITFPRSSKRQLSDNTPSIQEAFENLRSIKEEEMETVVDMICSNYIDTLEMAGFNVTEEPNVMNEVCFMMESVRAIVSKYYGIDHVFQGLAAECFVVHEGRLLFLEPKFVAREAEPVAEPDPSGHS